MVIPEQICYCYGLFNWVMFFSFPYKVENCPFKVCKELCWNFDWDRVNLEITFRRMTIFIMLIQLIHKHGRSFQFLIASSFSFFKDLKFVSWKSFTFSVRMTTRHFILFLTIVKNFVTLISFSVHLSFIYVWTNNFLR